jgi:hypothetical protein
MRGGRRPARNPGPGSRSPGAATASAGDVAGVRGRVAREEGACARELSTRAVRESQGGPRGADPLFGLRNPYGSLF